MGTVVAIIYLLVFAWMTVLLVTMEQYSTKRHMVNRVAAIWAVMFLLAPGLVDWLIPAVDLAAMVGR